MSHLKQHRLAELTGLGSGYLGGRPVLPGYYVRHRLFPNSFGIVVSYVPVFCHSTQILVLWSQPPTHHNEALASLQQKLSATLKIPLEYLGFDQ
jgi:hypothetical protein